MKKILLICLTVLLTVNCTVQEKPVTLQLQQVEFQDKELEKTLMNLCKNDSCCFNKNDYYVLDFFQSSLTNKEYYLAIDEFRPTSEDLDAIGYYVLVDDFIFLISKTLSQEIIKITPKIKNFRFYIMDAAFPCADYYFIIWKTPVGTYEVLLNFCAK